MVLTQTPQEIVRMVAPVVTSTLVLPANRMSGLIADEVLFAGDACHVTSAGRARRSIASSDAASSDVRGFALTDAAEGQPITLAFDVTMRYGSGLAGTECLYLSGGVLGGLSDAPTVEGAEPIAFVVNDTEIHLLQSPDREPRV
jgi:hypothetical protein